MCLGCGVLCHATFLEVRGQLIILSFYQMGSLRSKSPAGLVVIFFTFWATHLVNSPLPSLFNNSEPALSFFSLQCCTGVHHHTQLCFSVTLLTLLVHVFSFLSIIKTTQIFAFCFFLRDNLLTFWFIHFLSNPHLFWGMSMHTCVCMCDFCLVKFAQLFWWVFCVECLLCYTHANISCKLNSLGLEQWLKGWEHWLFFHGTWV